MDERGGRHVVNHVNVCALTLVYSSSQFSLIFPLVSPPKCCPLEIS